MPTRVSFEKAVGKVRALANVLHRPIRDVLDSGGRVAAVQLARSSVPFGTGNQAQQTGMRAVERDIYRVYATPGQAWESISNRRAKRAFWLAFKAGEFDAAERLLWDFSSKFDGVPLEKFDNGSAHLSRRSKSTGRVSSGRPAMVVTNEKVLFRYVEHKKEQVGFGKGGWADASRALGRAPRGLREDGDITANWITRHGHGFGAFARGGTEERPTLEIRNRVPYADQLFSPSGKQESLRIAHDRMVENLQIAVRAEARNLRSAA
jgi:hypothetical protein